MSVICCFLSNDEGCSQSDEELSGVCYHTYGIEVGEMKTWPDTKQGCISDSGHMLWLNSRELYDSFSG